MWEVWENNQNDAVSVISMHTQALRSGGYGYCVFSLVHRAGESITNMQQRSLRRHHMTARGL